MNKLPIILSLILSISVFAQESPIKIGKKENFFLTINKDETYIVKDVKYQSNTESIGKEVTLNLKRNSIDIYLNWINPLQYKLVIQDSVINDLRVEEVKKFFKENLTGLAGGSSLLKAGSSGYQPIDCSNINGNDRVSKIFPEVYNGFKAGSFKAGSDLCKYWQMMDALLELELLEEEKKVKNIIQNLYKADSPNKVQISYSAAEEIIKRIEENDNEIVAKLFQINDDAKKIDDVSKGVLKQRIRQFHKELSSSYKNIKRLIELLKTYMIQIKVSLKKKSPDFNNYYRIKPLKLKQGKSIKLNISLSTRELKKDFTLEDKSKIKEHKFLIQKYDFITPKIGTGLFYSSATLNGFGVTTNDQDELIVTQNDIDKNTVVTGIFLNLNFDINSQFLSPLIQIGVDPTKERPYLLLGGGFSIPVSNFAFSIGPIWTWEPELNDLKLDETVSSTSVLKEDLSYKFQTTPKGIYLGLNYSF
ncbi:hypothetical protein Q4Q39_01940 [Flavivirga amylovorans]|uniref:Uncharacterized protein n=1 Tax=Flavivirga amylovorans TaxID=870486 RepID=A0ABT8WXD2_9FLAO|nr:hypothetical protein [Flavivirga amylovorans]MDO5986152.1 hypothetical protein [Flavivirga amylovorans]